MKKLSIIMALLFFIIVSNARNKDDFPILKGPYLGQKPPGKTPKVFAPGILNNDKMGAFCTVFSPEGNEFFFVYYDKSDDESGGIYYSRLINNKYVTPEHINTVFNQDFIHGDMFVSPKENYMIISCKGHGGKIGYGGLDLYIIFRRSDGTWAPAINMGKSINTKNGENCPHVSPDGEYFFFNRYNPDLKKGDMYWVDAEIIEKLRTDKF